MSAAAAKTPLTYSVREMGTRVPGEKTRRAFLDAKTTVNLERLAQTMSGDHGRMAGRATHVESTVISIFESIHDELLKGNSVTVDDFLKFTPTLRGKVDPETGRPTAESTLGVAVHILRRMRLDIEDFELVNSEKVVGEPRFTGVLIAKSSTRDKIVRGSEFRVGGRYLHFDAEMGDTVVLSYVEDGETQSVSLTPSVWDSESMTFAWPAALAEVEADTEVEITLRTRAGVADGAFYSTSRKATIIEA